MINKKFVKFSAKPFIIFLIAFFASFSVLAQTPDVNPKTYQEENTDTQPELYVVNFTADWCPNCKVLDPALYKALENVDKTRVQHIAFDMTTPQRTTQTFERVNGTVLAGVYGDYLGITGIAVMIAADSGEKIDCATRLVTSEAIEASIENALEIVQTQPAGTRETQSILCPPANRKIPA